MELPSPENSCRRFGCALNASSKWGPCPNVGPELGFFVVHFESHPKGGQWLISPSVSKEPFKWRHGFRIVLPRKMGCSLWHQLINSGGGVHVDVQTKALIWIVFLKKGNRLELNCTLTNLGHSQTMFAFYQARVGCKALYGY